MKILIATEKPFAAAAVNGMKEIAQKAGHEVVLLEKYDSPEKLIKAVADVDALIVRSDKVTADVIGAAKNLKIVVRAGAGYDNINLEACTAKNIVAMNTPGQNSNAVAELAISMMIYMSRNQFTPGTGSEIKGKKLGIQAYGNVGRLVAQKAKYEGRRCDTGRVCRADVQRMQFHFSAHSGYRRDQKVHRLRAYHTDAVRRLPAEYCPQGNHKRGRA